ncbi:MAG: hypothetical protein BGO01_10895 [Armatimonadetes bacterium 55-13]|nr:hypothetical protein [Armatimonadota bacterium]OJU62898.1 MAG: hypothetical protein BGO01_10895 [Armatimonadetes bacterium 55-13]
MPLVTALILATVARSPVWDLAICARFYYPYKDKRKSEYRYYLMTLDGKQKRELPLKGKAEGKISWRDHTHLQWREIQGDSTQTIEWDLTSGTRRLLPTKKTEPKASEDSETVFLDLTDTGPALVTGRGMFRIKNPGAKWTFAGDLEGETEMDLDFFGGERYELSNEGATRSWGVMTSTVPVDAHVSALLLFKINFTKKEAWLIPADLNQVSVRVNRDLWVGCGTRNLGSHSEPDVWTNTLTIGKISQGPPKVVLNGRQYIRTVSLRP